MVPVTRRMQSPMTVRTRELAMPMTGPMMLLERPPTMKLKQTRMTMSRTNWEINGSMWKGSFSERVLGDWVRRIVLSFC